VAVPETPAAAAGGTGAAAASKEAVRRIKIGLLERLFSDNVMDLLLLLAQHAQQVGDVAGEQGVGGRAWHGRVGLCPASLLLMLPLLAQHAQPVIGGHRCKGSAGQCPGGRSRCCASNAAGGGQHVHKRCAAGKQAPTHLIHPPISHTLPV